MNTLYISYDGMTDPLGQSQVLPYLTGLANQGMRIHLISCEKPDRFEKGRQVIEAICKEAGITWHPIPYHSSPPVISTIRDVRAIFRLARALQREHRFALTHCRSYISALAGLSLKRKQGVPFLFDMRGFWADERIDGGLWRLSNPLYRLIYRYFKKKEKEYLLAADHIISLTLAGAEEMRSWPYMSAVPGNRITVIPCCVDTTLFDPARVTDEMRTALRATLGIASEKKIIGYIGSIGTWYLLDEMLEMYATIRKRQPASVFLFVTPDKPEHIIAAATGKGIPQSELVIASAARKEVPVFISIMDWSLFFIKPCFSKKASSPTKQGEIMAMGKPVICNAGVGDTERLVNDYHSGLVVHSFDGSDYQAAAASMEQTAFDPAQIREGALDYFSLDKGISLYSSVYRALTDKKREA